MPAAACTSGSITTAAIRSCCCGQQSLQLRPGSGASALSARHARRQAIHVGRRQRAAPRTAAAGTWRETARRRRRSRCPACRRDRRRPGPGSVVFSGRGSVALPPVLKAPSSAPLRRPWRRRRRRRRGSGPAARSRPAAWPAGSSSDSTCPASVTWATLSSCSRIAASIRGWRWPWMLHHRLLTPSRYSRPSMSTSVQPSARSMISGSYSAICVKACQTISRSQRRARRGWVRRRLVDADRTVSGLSIQHAAASGSPLMRLPGDRHRRAGPHAQHDGGAIAHDRQLQLPLEPTSAIRVISGCSA